jgi:hypothetical protein
MLRGLGDRRLACGRDLLFLRWVLVFDDRFTVRNSKTGVALKKL